MMLNDDTQRYVFTYLSENDIFIVNQVCKYYQTLIDDITFPSIQYIFSNVEYLDWFNDFKDFKVKKKVMFKYGIRYGDRKVLDWILDNIGRKYLTYQLYDYCENIDALNWLKKNRCEYDEMNLHNAFNNNKGYKIKWLKSELVWHDLSLLDYMKDCKKKDIEWILKSIPELSKKFCEYAILLNDIELLKWGINKKYKLTCTVFAIASGYGNLELLKYLYLQKCPINEWAINEAVCNNQYDVLDWLLDHGSSISEYALYDAKENKNKKIIDWINKRK